MNKITFVSCVGAAFFAGCATVPASTPFGETKNGQAVRLYTLRSKDGLRLEVSDYGGRLVRCWAPDRNGKLADVTMGWNTPAEYEKYGFMAGTLIGRFGNRIREGRFTIDGRTYQLPVNETTPAPRHGNVHSGPDGWDTVVWQARPFKEGDADCLELTHVCPDGTCGFPGTVNAKIVYRALPGNVWRIDYELSTDKTTVVNPTHHTYWNLAGEASGTVLDQQLKIYADEYTKTDAALIPTFNARVAGTPFDFTESRAIGSEALRMQTDASLAPMNNWYDHNFVLRGKPGELRPAAEMYDPKSGRTLAIWTTEPCLQMYGAQNLTDEYPAKETGKRLCKFAAIALETQHYPDSPNRVDFPSTVLRPGEVFRSTSEYRFGTR